MPVLHHIIYQLLSSSFVRLPDQRLNQFFPNGYRMSANYGNSDSSCRAKPLLSFSNSRTKGSSPVMELSPSQFHSAQQLIETHPESSSMSALAMERPLFPPASDMAWNDRRKLELPSRPRSPIERVELPSIRLVRP